MLPRGSSQGILQPEINRRKGWRARRQTAEEPPVQPRPAAGLARDPKKPGFPEWLGAWALLMATYAAYLPCLKGGFLWDDDAHVIGPGMQGLDGLLRIWIEPGATQQYYPLLCSAFWLEHRLWGNSVFFYHVLNVFLHAFGAYLLTRILRFLNVRGAWMAGFIFALHPVCVEAVAWISEQKSTLSGVFYFAAALMYLHFDRSRKWAHYAAALFLFLLALMSKTVTATLAPALLVVLWWRRGRLEWKRDVLPVIPWFVAGAAAGLTTSWVEKQFVGATGSEFELTFLQRSLLAGRVIWFYAGKVLWPSNLTFIYPHWTIDPHVWWQYGFAAAFVAGIGFLAWLARRNRAPLAAALYFAGTLFPALGFLNVYPFRYSYVADHFQYLACVGIIVPAAWFIAGLAERLPARSLSYAALAIPLAGLGLLSWSQTHMYTDGETLYRTTLERNPRCWMAENNLGILLGKIPARREEGIGHLRAAIQLKQGYPEAWNNIGSILSLVPGRQQDAMDHFRAALRIKPDYAEAHFNLGNEYYKLGDLPAALAEYRTAVKSKAGFAAALSNLGAMLVKDPRTAQEGLDDLRASVKADPSSIDARLNLANALAAEPGHSMEAQLEFEEILRRDPRSVETRIRLGGLLLKNPGEEEEAVEQFAAAVLLQPRNAEAHMYLSEALFRVPLKADQAMRELEIALRLDPGLKRAQEMMAQLKAMGK